MFKKNFLTKSNASIPLLTKKIPSEIHQAEDRFSYCSNSLQKIEESKEELLILAKLSSPEARKLLSYEKALEYSVLPLSLLRVGNTLFLYLAAAKKINLEVLKQIRFLTSSEIKIKYVVTHSLEEYIFKAYHSDGESLLASTTKLITLEQNTFRNFPCAPDIRSSEDEVAKFIEALVDYGVSVEASDIHIYPLSTGTFIKMRVQGKFQISDNSICSTNVHEKIINRIKIISNLDTTTRFLPQDGSFQLSFSFSSGAKSSGEKTTIRVSTMPTVHGEKCVLRLMKSSQDISLNTLKFDAVFNKILNLYLQRAQGALLIGGSTGSGKSTTLYACAHEFANQSYNVTSIEDPVEIYIDGIAQTSINKKQGMDFSNALSAMLRQDPDVILIGEIRDELTAKTALEASLTGHALLSSIHARTVEDIIVRLSHFAIDTVSIAKGISLLICQKLLSTLCNDCKVIDIKNSYTVGTEIMQAVGCAQCDYSGYGERKVISEFLVFDEKVQETILRAGSHHQALLSSLCSVVTSENYRSFKTALWEYLENGEISFEDYMKTL
jgi:type IV pilus assembly protein PilB